MLNKKAFLLPLVTVFLVCELILGILVQKSKGSLVVISSYACVVLACLFVSLFFEKSYDYCFTQAGLIFTVAADLFLVVIEPMQQLPAMIFFSFTQIFYFLRLYFMQGVSQRRIHLIVRIAASLVAILATIVVLKEKTDALSIVSLFYYANLAINIMFAFVSFKKVPLFAIGLFLFLLCDTVIGLNVMKNAYLPINEGSLIHKILSLNVNLAWIFYVPSQALIAISLVNWKSLRKTTP